MAGTVVTGPAIRNAMAAPGRRKPLRVPPEPGEP
jgi:hypothetical protein